MAKIDARGWIFQVSDGQPTPTWLEIASVNSFEYSRSENEETVDTTVFSSNGLYEGQVMQRGASLNVEGLRDSTAGVVDPGQARVDALATFVGDASLGQIRFRHNSDSEWTVWTAYVSPGSLGGGNNDKTSWSATFTRSGVASTAAVV
ncbi:hypothetical protein GCM10012275_54480 [Longimycelium tulufanense]|uniref:Phage tail protein n=1 Tax=Longimycelium tulufanense TaxID=907463 RepID=A0A8J3CJM6_9PSEU|nr:hypothetical protein [Longimycelium tulufanense]GGM76893.1 hypothetical protein GCM10012275_54480 [Longimycelium tulufanense]